jgi:hypothetical protein
MHIKGYDVHFTINNNLHKHKNHHTVQDTTITATIHKNGQFLGTAKCHGHAKRKDFKPKKMDISANLSGKLPDDVWKRIKKELRNRAQ